MAPNDKPSTIFGIVGAVLLVVGVGFLVANRFDPGTAITVVACASIIVSMGTFTFPEPTSTTRASP